MRLSLNLLSVLAVALMLQAGLCPTLCLARSGGSPATHTQDVRAPEKAPCHAANDAPSRATHSASSQVMIQAASRTETSDACGMECSQLGGVVLASLATRVDPDAPTAALSIHFSGLRPQAHLAVINPRVRASEPPPRNLLLVKNSFLI